MATDPTSTPAATDDITCDLAVLGGGPGGYTAAFRAADLGLAVVLIERAPTLGGVCLRVGCIPSKTLLHAAKIIDDAAAMATHGIDFGPPRIDLDRLRAFKDGVIAKSVDGLAGLAKQRRVRVLTGSGRFTGSQSLRVDGAGGPVTLRFAHCIVAVGSEPVRLPGLPDDPRIVDSTGALALPDIPGELLIVGGGIIGLEMGCVYATLGSRVTVVELAAGIMPGADRDVVRPLERALARRFAAIRTGTKVTAMAAAPEGIVARFEGPDAPPSQRFDRVLVAVGRRANGGAIDAAQAGLSVDARGIIAVDGQMRTNVPHIFAIGDVVGDPMLAHKASHQGKVAAEVAAGQKRFFDARVIPAVAYTDPEVAWVGLTETEARAQGVAVGKGVFPWAASGRARAMAQDAGLTKLLFDPASRRLVGAAVVGVNAGELIGELALAVEMGADAEDIASTVHAHPTLHETVGLAAEVFEGSITDLPPARKP